MKPLKTFIASSCAALAILVPLLCVTPSFASGDVENHKHCKQCAMGLASFEQSKMIIVYEDGTIVEV
jgi:hypothetical protein